VRPRELQRRMRRDLAWCLVGFLVVQMGLGLCQEVCWQAGRDPDFDALLRIIRRRQAETPSRPLVLVLGSSRTSLNFRAERLNRPTDETAPLVINAAMIGGGPMLEQIYLRRLLRAGVRPNLVFVETAPMFLSAREGVPLEEGFLSPAKLTAAEAARLWTYYAEPSRLRH
jgi:hypothetical protein